MEIKFSTVFQKFRAGYHNFRIPALLVSKQGTLIAFSEARRFRGDQTRNDIVLKRSSDCGQTWGKMVMVATMGRDSLNNPVPVMLEDTGRILLMFQQYPYPAQAGDVVAGWGDPGKKKRIRGWKHPLRVVRTYITYSDDDGVTWTPPDDITKQIKRPQEVTTLSSGPGCGIQLHMGQYIGRILIPFNEGPRKAWKVFAAISDDDGVTWTTGSRIPDNNIRGCGNENQFVELTDGTIMCNARNLGREKTRLVATSNDGCNHGPSFKWKNNYPTRNAKGVSFGIHPPKMGLNPGSYFPTPPHKIKGYNGTVYLSYDEGKTWPVSKSIYPSHRKFAYSCLTTLPDQTIGCIFEADSFYAAKKLIFAHFDIEWLTDGEDKIQRGK